MDDFALGKLRGRKGSARDPSQHLAAKRLQGVGGKCGELVRQLLGQADQLGCAAPRLMLLGPPPMVRRETDGVQPCLIASDW